MTLREPTWDDARAAAHASAVALPVEDVAVGAASARVLASDVLPATALPPWDYSAMDGWAVSGTGPWRVIGRVLAGTIPVASLAPGEAVGIATGAPVPAGTTAVLRSEDGTMEGSLLAGAVDPGRDIRWAGEECRADEVIVPAGTRITPAVLGALCAAGCDVVDVRRRPTARVLVFGDELLDSGPPRGGRVRDSLGPQVPLWLERMGVDVLGVMHVEDTLESHVQALESASGVDIVVTTGGTAAGPVDHLHRALDAIDARLVVDQVACRPGHPQLLARWDTAHVLGLPGNPQSAVVALMTLGQALIDGLQAMPLRTLDEVVMDADVGAPVHETRIVAARLRSASAVPVDHLGSGMLRGLAAADGFAVVPPGGVIRGTTVRWLPLP